MTKGRVHTSWLIAGWGLGFVVGVWLAVYVSIGPVWLWLGIPLSAGLFWLRRVVALPLVLGAVLVGLVYGSWARGALDIYQSFMGQHVELKGRVREDPSLTDGGKLALQLDQIIVAEHELSGAIWTGVRKDLDIKRGDVVTVKGRLGEGFGTFPALLQNPSVVNIARPVPGDVGRVVRDWFADKIRLGIPEPEASLGIGYLTGQKSALPGDLSDALQIAGLSHIVVASGYNLTILVRLSRRLFMRISKYVAAFGSGVMITCFVAVTGLSPSMTRAGLVAGLSLLAWYYGRKFHPFVLLPFAAAVTVAFQPHYVWGDLGWQLSFAAFAGVMIVAPLLQRFFFGDKEPGTLRQILGETVAAHIVTVPIVALSFGVISNVAIPANLLIVPLVPLAMLLTFIVGLTAIFLPFMVELVGLPANWLLTYMTTTARYAADLPWSQLELVPEWWMAVLYYGLLVVVCLLMWRVTKADLRHNLVE